MLSIGRLAAIASASVSMIPGAPPHALGAPAHPGVELALRC
jgi:hypothetical protein